MKVYHIPENTVQALRTSGISKCPKGHTINDLDTSLVNGKLKCLKCVRPTRRKCDHAQDVNLRKEFIREYGGCCQCECGCREATPECLTCDHIFNDGAEEYREWFGTDSRRSGSRLLRKLKALGWPKDRHQCLCYNCNCGRHRTIDKRCPKLRA